MADPEQSSWIEKSDAEREAFLSWANGQLENAAWAKHVAVEVIVMQQLLGADAESLPAIDAAVVLKGLISAKDEAAKDAFMASAVERFSEMADDVDVSVLPGEAMPVSPKIVDLQTGGKTALGQLVGQVLLLDFFALWCGPCAAPMNENQKMLAAHPDWEGRFTVIALSLDEVKGSTRELYEELQENEWTDVEFYWCGDKGFESDVAKAFHVTGIPHCVLVDASGVVVWSGHPSAIDLEGEVTRLLDGTSTLLANGPQKVAAEVTADSEWLASIPATGAAWGTRASVAARSEALIAIRDIALKHGLELDMLLDEETLTRGPRGAKREASLTLAGSFGTSQRAAVAAAVGEIKALVSDVELEIDLFNMAEPLPVASVCGKCAGALDAAPRLACVHCDTTLCQACCFAEDANHPKDHVFAHCGPDSEVGKMRHGRGTWPLGDPSLDKDVVDGAHTGVACDGCGGNPLIAFRFKCAMCPDFDLCPPCFDVWVESDGLGPDADEEMDDETRELVDSLTAHPKTHAFLVLPAGRGGAGIYTGGDDDEGEDEGHVHGAGCKH